MKTILVGNLAATATEVELRTLFEAYGEIAGVDMARGQDFAYVRMTSQIEASDAIKALHGIKLYGKDLEVRLARSQHSLKHPAKTAATVLSPVSEK